MYLVFSHEASFFVKVKYEQMHKNLESVSKQLEEAQQQIQLRELNTGSPGGGKNSR